MFLYLHLFLILLFFFHLPPPLLLSPPSSPPCSPQASEPELESELTGLHFPDKKPPECLRWFSGKIFICHSSFPPNVLLSVDIIKLCLKILSTKTFLYTNSRRNIQLWGNSRFNKNKTIHKLVEGLFNLSIFKHKLCCSTLPSHVHPSIFLLLIHVQAVGVTF